MFLSLVTIFMSFFFLVIFQTGNEIVLHEPVEMRLNESVMFNNVAEARLQHSQCTPLYQTGP